MRKPCGVIIFFSLLVGIFYCAEALAVSFTVGGVRLEKKDVKSMKEIKTHNINRQSLDFSCGAAGISTLLSYYFGHPVTEQEILGTLLQTVSLEKVKARRGFSLLDLKNFVELKGYKATGYQMDFDFLRELGKPVLVPIKFKNYRHFVIVKAVVGDRVFLADPAVGNMTMKTTRFANIWLDGIGLVIEDPNVTAQDGLPVNEKDMLFADYKNAMRTAQQNVIRTAIFPNEYKLK